MAWPDFVIAGAQRSGTSWLWKNLSAVPGFDMAIEKEPAFFSMPERYEMGLKYYRDSFKDDGGLKGDATADYLYYPAALPLLRRDSPACRVIVLLRDPVQRALSAYWMERTRGNEVRPPEEALFANEGNGPLGYLRRGLYAEQLDRLWTAFPVEQTMVLQTEAMWQDPAWTIERVCLFLGVAFPDRVPHIGIVVTAFADKRPVPYSVVDALRAYYREPNEALKSRVSFNWDLWGRP